MVAISTVVTTINAIVVRHVKSRREKQAALGIVPPGQGIAAQCPGSHAGVRALEFLPWGACTGMFVLQLLSWSSSAGVVVVEFLCWSSRAAVSVFELLS